jgi:DUF438 domain-containing protein
MSEVINNRRHRLDMLKSIIRHLHSGASPEEVRQKMKTLAGETDYSEIVAMEQELIAEGMPVDEIRSMCDLHSQVMRDVLVQLPKPQLPPGHPADTFRRENEALGELIGEMRRMFRRVSQMDPDCEPAGDIMDLRQSLNQLMDIDKHYQRKEHTLFPKLEKHGIFGPPKVMWAKDDEVRGKLKELDSALRQQATARIWTLVGATMAEAAFRAVEEMIHKENRILLPMCLDVFTDEDWGEIWSASPRYGWCLVEPQTGYQPPAAVRRQGLALAGAESITMPTGTLSLEQLLALFSTLPVDVTFIDADDRVAFFSEGPDRVFARSRAVLGRKVQHCHPPRSVDTVNRIVDSFREGTQDVAEFWINFHGRFVHIRYFAVRGAGGQYLGTLEVTQDVTRIRALEGERRLLEFA